MAAPGSELLIHLLPTLWRPKRVVVLATGYSSHARAWRAAGSDVLETAAPLVEANLAEVVMIGNPNNPDGQRFATEEIEDARRQQ